MTAVLPLFVLLLCSGAQPEGVAEALPGDETGESREKIMRLSDEQKVLLKKYAWNARVGHDKAIWVSVKEQRLRVIEDGAIVFEGPCSTASKGIGAQMNSLMTPSGWHSVKRKTGADAPWGQVFRSRMPTDEVWKRGGNTTEDLILTRILILQGEEEGKNKGGNVDSFLRNIYVHGTNDEAAIGSPVSHGCVRLTNDDVIEAFGLVGEGDQVLITKE